MLNMDFNQPVVIDTRQLDWIASPMPGVWRKLLAREEAERGHATSIVRYEAGAAFSAHGHPKGEEILVLEGVFSDQTGDYPAGTYFRNPEGFSHAPFSNEGCVILVKLHQFQPDDAIHLVVDTGSADWQETDAGQERLNLHQHRSEEVFMLRSRDRSEFQCELVGGLEALVIAGTVSNGIQSYPEGSWLRMPSFNGVLRLSAGAEIWLKTGHLKF